MGTRKKSTASGVQKIQTMGNPPGHMAHTTEAPTMNLELFSKDGRWTEPTPETLAAVAEGPGVMRGPFIRPQRDDATTPLSEIRVRADTGKRHIALFDGLGSRLPVKRVVVGPGVGQADRAERVRSSLGDVMITLSRCL
jgi:hypothetical protein